MQWFDQALIDRYLPPELARQAIEQALLAPETGRPFRQRIDQQERDSLWMTTATPRYVMGKWLHIRPANRSHFQPTLPGIAVLADAETGETLCAADGAVLTGVRTAAIAAVSTQHLAISRRTLAFLGAGWEALFHITALLDLGGVERIYLWNRSLTPLLRLAQTVRKRWPDVEVKAAKTIEEAVQTADVVTLITGSVQPLISRRDLRPGVLINAMGAYQPTTREVASDIMAAATVFADTKAGCLQEAGDVMIPLQEGVLAPSAIFPLAEALRRPMTRPPQNFIVMKSIGAAI
ncbi:MAG: hypothetical protein OWS74_04925, partial [Firmicutes bacterium]|nr:hypothetical protein [Bacillota bacterium]